MREPEAANEQHARGDEDALLAEWCIRLSDALNVNDLNVDLKAVLGLAGRAAHAVIRPAAPLTTFVVGYAAGLAAAGGKPTEAAVSEAVEIAARLCLSEQCLSEQRKSEEGTSEQTEGA